MDSVEKYRLVSRVIAVKKFFNDRSPADGAFAGGFICLFQFVTVFADGYAPAARIIDGLYDNGKADIFIIEAESRGRGKTCFYAFLAELVLTEYDPEIGPDLYVTCAY